MAHRLARTNPRPWSAAVPAASPASAAPAGRARRPRSQGVGHARRFAALAVVLALGLLSLPPLPLAAAPAEQGKGLTPLRLVVFTVAPALVAARDRGYLEAEGLDV